MLPGDRTAVREAQAYSPYHRRNALHRSSKTQAPPEIKALPTSPLLTLTTLTFSRSILYSDLSSFSFLNVPRSFLPWVLVLSSFQNSSFPISSSFSFVPIVQNKIHVFREDFLGDWYKLRPHVFFPL